jgi:uncharacterized membrane protein
MDPKIELKLIETISQFAGLPLKTAQFKQKIVGGKDLLTLELIFSDNGLWKTMVLVLNKDITTGDYQELYNEIIK